VLAWLAARGPAGTSFLALFGAALAFAILYIDYPFPRDAHKFTESGPYFLWLVLLCGQMALWMALLPTLTRAVREFEAYWPKNRAMVSGVTTAFALLVVLPIVIGELIHSTPEYPLPAHGVKIPVITFIAVVVALVGAAAVALVYAAMGDAFKAKGSVAATEIERFFGLRASLVQLLAIEGAILGAAILATGALRHAVVALSGEAGFPKETLLAYGIYLSAVVALLYGPTYMRLLELGRHLRDRMVPLDDSSPPSIDRLEQRQKLDVLLDLEVSASTSFRSGLLILTPLTTSLVGLLIGKT
jgi:hypothetical protein